MASTTYFVSHDRQGFLQLGSYNYVTSNLTIKKDTNPESKKGEHGLLASREVEKLISIVVSFNRGDSRSVEQTEQVYNMMSAKSNHASYGGHGFGTLVKRTFQPDGKPRDYIPYKVNRETASKDVW